MLIKRRPLLTGVAASLALAEIAKGAIIPPPATPPVGPSKFGAIQTRMPFWGGNATTGAGYTLQSVFTAESDFDQVRLVYFNFDTAPHVITSAAVAASSLLGNTSNPSNAAGTADTTLWVPVTFNNGGAAGDSPSPSGSIRTCTIPAAVQNTLSGTAASDRVAGMAFSDWMPVQSLARQDAGATLPLLFCRTYSAAGINAPSISLSTQTPTGGGAWDAPGAGRIMRLGYTSGDIATTPGNSLITANSYLAPTAVQFLSRKRGMSVMIVGDSLFQGFGTATYQNDPYEMIATTLSTPAFPVIVTKIAYQGMSSLSFLQNGYQAAAAMKPDVLVIKAESPNDNSGTTPGTAALYEASIARALAMADWATRQDCVPVLATAQPWGYTGTTEANRVAFNAAIRASNYLYVDHDAAVSNGGSPAVIQAAFNSAVNPLHYNDAGAAAIAAAGLPIFQKIMAARPR